MGYIRFKNGVNKFYPSEVINSIWEVYNGDKPGTMAQREFVRGIKQMILNYQTAPASYLEKRRQALGIEQKEPWWQK